MTTFAHLDDLDEPCEACRARQMRALMLEAALDGIDNPLWWRRTKLAVYVLIFVVSMWLGV